MTTAGRITYIDRIPFASGSIITEKPDFVGRNQTVIECPVDGRGSYYIHSESKRPKVTRFDDTVYNFPVLWEDDGITPWHDGNQFLWSLLFNKTDATFKQLNHKAKQLMEYKLFTEANYGYDLLDFKSLRPAHRVSYAYFYHLLKRGISAGNLNQHTATVYQFYEWLNEQPHIELDLTRVDKTHRAFIKFETNWGKVMSKEVKVRSQMVVTPQASSVRQGFVRDEGEDLRPLYDDEFDLLCAILGTTQFTATERMIYQVALDTGARKQTVLTLRKKHVDKLMQGRPDEYGTVRLNCSSAIGIDTKGGRVLAIHFPRELIERLHIYVNSADYMKKVAKFKAARKPRPEDLQEENNEMPDDDIYVFLSNQGNPLYMAKDDPLYRKLKTPPEGNYLQTVTRKIKAAEPKHFPSDYTFHWTRATYAYRFYKFLTPLVDSGQLGVSDAIVLIQRRLGHKLRETTEHYLQLFKMTNLRLEAQERYEERLFDSVHINEEVA